MTESDCPFCEIVTAQSREWVDQSDQFVAFRDQYPVAEGHTLVVPRRHVVGFDSLPEESGSKLIQFLQAVQKQIRDRYQPDGFNIGLNDGTAAGQTIEHLHWHIIPRYHGDVPDPEGGVRGVIPDRQSYG